MLETRSDVNKMIALSDLIDLVIPRGSKEFVSWIMRDSSIPVLGHADGVCHVYVDASANLAKSMQIILDSKMPYVAVDHINRYGSGHTDAIVSEDEASTDFPL